MSLVGWGATAVVEFVEESAIGSVDGVVGIGHCGRRKNSDASPATIISSPVIANQGKRIKDLDLSNGIGKNLY